MFTRGVVFIKLKPKCTHVVKQNKLATLSRVSSTITTVNETTSIDKLIMHVKEKL
jgi:hypothetical protein